MSSAGIRLARIVHAVPRILGIGDIAGVTLVALGTGVTRLTGAYRRSPCHGTRSVAVTVIVRALIRGILGAAGRRIPAVSVVTYARARTSVTVRMCPALNACALIRGILGAAGRRIPAVPVVTHARARTSVTVRMCPALDALTHIGIVHVVSRATAIIASGQGQAGDDEERHGSGHKFSHGIPPCRFLDSMSPSFR